MQNIFYAIEYICFLFSVKKRGESFELSPLLEL